MPTLPTMGLVAPVLGGDRGVWDNKVNACLTLVDAHDHKPGKGARVTTTALEINADLVLNSFRLTSPIRLGLSANAAPSGSLVVYASSTDNELYWRNATGTPVKLTAGGTINLALIGGIVGDYATVGAEIAFDDANDRYTFKQQGSPKPWAKMASADVRIYPAGSAALYTGLKAAAIASPFDITLPVALPSTTNLLMLDSAGIVTAPASVTLASGGNLVLSGTGYIKRASTQSRVVITSAFKFNTAAAITTSGGTAGTNIPANSTAWYPLETGTITNELIQSVNVTVNTVSGGNPTYSLVTADSSGAFSADLAGATLATNATTFTLTPNTPVTGAPLWLKIITGALVTLKITEADVVSTVP